MADSKFEKSLESLTLKEAMERKYDVIIVGAGPAGMFASHECVEHGLKVLVIDAGKSMHTRACPMNKTATCTHCEPCNIMGGVGGAGTYSDGILNLRPDVGGDLESQTGDREYAWNLIRYVDDLFVYYGAPKSLYIPKTKEVEELKVAAASVDARFIDIVQRHIGSDNAPRVIRNFEDDLRLRGVDFLLTTRVTDLIIENGKCIGVIAKRGNEEGKLYSEYTILSPGRVGANFVDEMVKKYGIKAKYGPIDIGVRVEVPAIVMDKATKINRDPKFHIRTKRYDDFVRTFCTNERGFVVKEEYEGFICTNGHSMTSIESENTNFAFLVRIELTEPLENTTKYGRSVAKLATTIGGGKPIVQRLGDLRRGRRSTAARLERNHVRNTLTEVTPGDISMALPHRIVMNIIEGLEKLNEIIPGVASDSTLLYAPEIKFYAMHLAVDRNFQTSIPKLFAAGDGAGLSRDIVKAAATGILAARGIMNVKGIKPKVIPNKGNIWTEEKIHV